MKKAILSFVLAAIVVAGINAQSLVTLYQPLGTNVASDTVTNGATAYLTSAELAANVSNPISEVVVQAVVTEISGTTAGTITLMGTIDGTNYAALTDSTTVPAITTKSPADVTTAQTFMWRVTGSPCTKYRVSYTGAGTMSARFSATLIRMR